MGSNVLTEQYILEQIEFFAEQMRVATEAQSYSNERGSSGQFEVKKAALAEVRKSLEFWMNLLKTHYPNSLETGKEEIEIWLVGINEL